MAEIRRFYARSGLYGPASQGAGTMLDPDTVDLRSTAVAIFEETAATIFE